MFDIPSIKEIIAFLLHPSFSGWFLILKIILLITGLAFLGFIVFVLITTTWLKRLIIWDWKEFLTFRAFGVKKIEKDWQEIKKKLGSESESDWKLALIEADKMLDDTLSRTGFSGASVGERLDKLTTATLPNLQELRQAHKIRNNIIHDPTYLLTIEEAKRAILTYEKALSDLQAL